MQDFLETLIKDYGMGGRVYVSGAWCDSKLFKAREISRIGTMDPDDPVWCRVTDVLALRDLGAANALE